MSILQPIKLQPLPDNFELREVQKTAIEQARESIRKGNRRIVLHLPCGAGKTFLAGVIFRQILKKKPTARCFFIVNRNVLLKQTKKVFEDVFGYDCSIIQGQNNPDFTKHIQIGTIQTLNNRLKSDRPTVWQAYNELEVDCCFVDEIHLTFEGYKTIKEVWDPLMLGLTGTPFTKGMSPFWQDVVRPASMASLIEDGVLSKYKVFACQAIDREKLHKMSTGEYRDKEVNDEVDRITGDVFEEWKKNPDMEGRPFLLFTKSIKSCIAIAEHFSKNGVKIGYVHSKMSEEDIQNEIDAFKAGHFVGMASVVMLIEGFDYPDVSAIIDCAPLAPSSSDPNIPASPNRYIQKISRGLRAKSDGYLVHNCLVHDHAGNFITYGDYEFIEELFPTLDDGKKKKKTLTPEERKKRVVRECRICGHIIKTNKCPQCRTETKKPTQFLAAGDLVFEDGVMVEIKSSGQPAEHRIEKKMTQEERMSFCQELKGHIDYRRYIQQPIKKESGFYAYKYKERTGKWPGKGYRFEEIKGKTPSKAFQAWMFALNRQYRNELVSKKTLDKRDSL